MIFLIGISAAVIAVNKIDGQAIYLTIRDLLIPGYLKLPCQYSHLICEGILYCYIYNNTENDLFNNFSLIDKWNHIIIIYLLPFY